MKRLIGVAALLGLFATGALATSAFAQCGPLGSGVLIDFDEGFAYETAYDNATYMSSPGSQLSVVGKIVLWCAPFNDLQANLSDPTKEYTFLITATSLGTVTSPYGTSGIAYDTDYGEPQFWIYEGSPANAPGAPMPANPPNATVPANFTDGTLILQGVMDTLHVRVTRSSTGFYSGSVRGDYQFTGGTLYGRVGDGTALFTGSWCPDGVGSGRCDLPDGYSAKPNAKWDSPPTTSNVGSTWGAIKQLYR